MITGDYEMLQGIAKTHICPLHPDNSLEVAWHQEGFYVIGCGAGHFPDEVTRPLTPTQAYKAGETAPGPSEELIKKGIRRRSMQQGNKPTAVTFQGVPAQDLGTGELLSLETIRALVKYAEKYGLDPARGHVCLMYGKPYITIDGYLYHAHKTRTRYSLTSFPLNEAERAGFQVPEGAHAWLANVKLLPNEGDFLGLGIVTKEEMEAKSTRDPTKLRSPVVAAHPWALAQKRAEWQALRRAFPIGESGDNEVQHQEGVPP